MPPGAVKLEILGKEVRQKAKYTIFNKKITFLLEPNFSCILFLMKTLVINKYSQIFVDYVCSF